MPFFTFPPPLIFIDTLQRGVFKRSGTFTGLEGGDGVTLELPVLGEVTLELPVLGGVTVCALILR